MLMLAFGSKHCWPEIEPQRASTMAVDSYSNLVKEVQ